MSILTWHPILDDYVTANVIVLSFSSDNSYVVFSQ